MQIHTGFGDKDLDLRLSSPLHLRRVLEDPAFAALKLVLLHASYPFCREAGYLANVYAQVWPQSMRCWCAAWEGPKGAHHWHI